MPEVQELIAPDGGWGWMVVLAFAISNMIVVPLIHGFGLIYKETFVDLGMSSTSVTVIMNVNTAFGMSLGLINGPLLRKFGFRKVALVGGVLSVIGITTTAPARTFTHFIATYSIITSVGFSFIFASYSLALNTYFKKRRNRAAGIAMTITGIGPIFVPHMINKLVQEYGAMGCMLIFGAIATHTIPTALLLQPIKWHMKNPNCTEELKDINRIDVDNKDSKKESETLCDADKEQNNANIGQSKDRADKSESQRVSSVWDIFLAEDESEYLEKPRTKRPATIALLEDDLNLEFTNWHESTKLEDSKRHSDYISRRFTNIFRSLQKPIKAQRKYASQPMISTVKNNDKISNRPTPVQLLDVLERNQFKKTTVDMCDKEKYDEVEYKNEDASLVLQEKLIQEKTPVSTQNGCLSTEPENPAKKPNTNCCLRLYQFFELGLLTDPTYVVIMIGISTAIFSEMNFSMLTPFILGDMGLSTGQIASVMSSIAIADIITRFVCPFVGEYFKQSPRMMFTHSVVILLLLRTGLIYSNSYLQIVLVGLGIGVSKGIRTVYTGLIIPNYVSLDRLPCAFGLQNVSNGIFVMGFGPMLGVIRDYSGSYTKVMIFLNIVMLAVIVMWGAENWWKTRKSVQIRENDDNK